jgi:murein DD-endopeptidase MepM/ murein hydrolase activator NlpD
MGHRTQHVRALAAVVAALVAFGVAPAGAQTPPAPGVAAAANSLSAARARAQQAAEHYLVVLQDLQETDAQIGQVAREIPVLEAAVDELNRRLDERAGVAYRGAASRSVLFFEMFDTDDVLDSTRLAHIAGAANRETGRMADEATDLAAQLEQQKAELDARKAEQAALVEQAERQSAELDRALADAARRLRAAEHDAALRAWREAVEVAALQPNAAQPPPPEPISSRPPPADPSAAALVPISELICPVAAPVTFVNDWGQPRSNWRVHEGTDVFAAQLSPNVAVADGTVRRRVGGLGGNAVWLDADHGVSYYYAHLDHFEGVFDGPEQSRRVVKGEVVGYTGNTGNAAGGPYHTHFEVHPGGGGAINPYRILLAACAVELGEG